MATAAGEEKIRNKSKLILATGSDAMTMMIYRLTTNALAMRPNRTLLRAADIRLQHTVDERNDRA